MPDPAPLVEILRGPLVESVHFGHAAVVNGKGETVLEWGDPDAVSYPRSSSKMIQALPLVESGVAAGVGLTSEHLALACASHSAGDIHSTRVLAWMNDLGLPDRAFLCGPQEPRDKEARDALIREGGTPCRYHNNCSGKHCGFLTWSLTMKVGPDYTDMDHPLQRRILQAFEEVTDAASPAWGIDGCSAPNHATTPRAMARAMAAFATAHERSDGRSYAMVELREAMMAHPELVANPDRACTRLMRAAKGKAALKTGAEGYFIAILPGLGLGLALKIVDGATRAAECATAAILVKLGVLDANDPEVKAYLNPQITNFAGLVTGEMRATI